MRVRLTDAQVAAVEARLEAMPPARRDELFRRAADVLLADPLERYMRAIRTGVVPEDIGGVVIEGTAVEVVRS